MKYIPLFVLIQLVSAVLFIVGLPVCAACAFTGRWPRWTWVWQNEEDGVIGPAWYNPGKTRWLSFKWTALRNSVNNLRYVPRVSKVGRPLWIRNWTISGKVFYAKAGWLSNGYPVMSAGAGRW